MHLLLDELHVITGILKAQLFLKPSVKLCQNQDQLHLYIYAFPHILCEKCVANIHTTEL